jgi:ABC-2 type transport system ATP-binding protein
MHQPDLLILDEPTSGLDPLLQDEFHHLVRETAAAGSTVFLSSHELDEVQRLVDRLAIIRDGRIVVTDTVAGLRAAAPRTIEFRFGAPVTTAAFDGLDGVRIISCDRTHVVMSLTGALGPLLSRAAALNPTEMTARPADLDELFLSYYRTSSEGDARGQ